MADHNDEHSDALDQDEPQTPFWLTLLGGTLFLAAALFVLIGEGESEDPSPTGQPPLLDAEQAGSAEAD